LERFIARYRSLVTGVLSGSDRLVFRGSLLPLFRDGGMFFFLEAAPATHRDHRRLSAKVSRQLRLLRAHGAIKRIPMTHRYRLTSRGLLLTAALQATRRANIKDPLKAA
jgi:hypothetical protein